MISRKVFDFCGVVSLGAFMYASPQAFAQLSGAIFTTDSTGTVVNGNNYTAKTDVYLDGGPQPNAPCSASGLPNGSYYFQVTNPSGSLLLSTDPVANRLVAVSGGVIVSYASDGVSTPHATGSGKCPGSISIQLMPYADTDNPGGEYKAWMTPVGSYDPTHAASCDGGNCWGFPNSSSKTDNFRIKTSTCPQDDPNCHPIEFPTITGYKFYDANVNGQKDPGEDYIPGWKITIAPPVSGNSFTYTTSAGQYSFVVAPLTTYLIAELFPNANWKPTTLTSGSVMSSSVGDTPGPNFGNVCLGAGGGLTLGFWSNQNGSAIMKAGDNYVSVLAFLSALNLRNADGSDFDPTTYTQFRNWVLSTTATNMANMLSAQMAAMQLNVRYNKVNGGSYIYAPGANSANAFGFATISAILSEANTELGLHGLVLSDSSSRAYQEALKNALDQANNNLNFVQPGLSSCPFTTPY